MQHRTHTLSLGGTFVIAEIPQSTVGKLRMCPDRESLPLALWTLLDCVYPRGMASNPTGPAPADRSPPRAGAQGDDRPERYGTVAVARHVKEDGVSQQGANSRPTLDARIGGSYGGGGGHCTPDWSQPSKNMRERMITLPDVDLVYLQHPSRGKAEWLGHAIAAAAESSSII